MICSVAMIPSSAWLCSAQAAPLPDLVVAERLQKLALRSERGVQVGHVPVHHREQVGGPLPSFCASASAAT